MYKAVVIDLDGTLLNDEKKVGKDDLLTLYELGKKDIVRIIATGRSLFSFHEVVNNTFPIDYLIFDAGGGIINFKTKEILISHFLLSEDVKYIAEKLSELKIDFQVRNKIPDSHKYFYKRFLDCNPDFDRLNMLYKNYSTELSSFSVLSDASRFIAISPVDDIVKIITDEFAEYSIIRASSPIDNKSVWMEIYPKNVNKGSSLKYLCNKLKISMSETVGLGNDYNDIEFLNITGKSFIVSNAPKILKERYTITVRNNENPLTEIVKNVFI
ncbi:MAG: HAD-IIB family hydrolase [Chlorobi bacterium]|nr:HAD-IIB family hydrolase [Chlorobiota bacterium]